MHGDVVNIPAILPMPRHAMLIVCSKTEQTMLISLGLHHETKYTVSMNNHLSVICYLKCFYNAIPYSR